jgi:hypothetical protein
VGQVDVFRSSVWCLVMSAANDKHDVPERILLCGSLCDRLPCLVTPFLTVAASHYTYSSAAFVVRGAASGCRFNLSQTLTLVSSMASIRAERDAIGLSLFTSGP